MFNKTPNQDIMMNKEQTTITKLIFYTVFISFGLYVNGCAQTNVDDNSSPELLAQTLLHSIKTGDQELLNKYLITPEEDVRLDTTIRRGESGYWYTNQMNEYLKTKASQEERIKRLEGMGERTVAMLGGTERMQKKIDEEHPDFILANKLAEAQERHRQASTSGIQQILKNFTQQGLTDLSNVEFDRYAYDMAYNLYTNNTNLYFKNGELNGVMRFASFVKMPDGKWKIQRLPVLSAYSR